MSIEFLRCTCCSGQWKYPPTLDLLRLAGEIDENQDDDRIKHDHVELARSRRGEDVL